MPKKKIILCFDGTCNDPEDAVQSELLNTLGRSEDTGITNILKLHLMFGGNLKRPVPESGQMSFYYQGVGTYGSWFDRLRNSLWAPEQQDVGDIIKQATRDLYRVYRDGDEIFLFGFSRGAAIARRFAAVLPDSFAAFGKSKPKFRFVGVFDTVAAINKPNLMNEKKRPASDVVFENKTIAPAIMEALHLVALDERRIPFFPTLMDTGKRRNNQGRLVNEDRVTEIWFPGAHADIGGGYHFDGLSDVALQFMLDELERRNLGLKITPPAAIDYANLSDDDAVEIDLQDVIVQPNHLGKCHRQEAITHVKDAFLGDRVLRVSENQLHSVRQPVLHHSVVDRIYEDREYVPLPLMRERRIHPYTGELVNHCVWYETGIVDNFESLTTHRISGSRPLIRLAVGKSHKFTVYANQKFNSSGLLVNKGEKYSFKINMKQRWFDANISAGPDGWDRKGQDLSLLKDVVIRFSENDRRCPEARWFEVVGCINKSDDVVFRLLKRTKSKPYSVPLKGELFAFANDVGDRYGNNLGSIKVGVTRIA